MPRYLRLFLPDIPLHIVQRGHDRQPVFVERADRQYYINNLRETTSELSIHVYAYCLMTNHVHLLIAPKGATENVSKLMRVLAGRQTRYVNKLEKRSGTLWEGRFKASLVESERYLLACYRYIDLNPVRAGIVTKARDYEWSSCRQHIAICDDNWLDASDAFLALGARAIDRCAAYAELASEEIEMTQLSAIRTAIKRNQITGSKLFQDNISKRIGRRVSSRAPGRPRVDK